MRGKTPRRNELKCIISDICQDTYHCRWSGQKYEEYADKLEALIQKVLRNARKRREAK